MSLHVLLLAVSFFQSTYMIMIGITFEEHFIEYFKFNIKYEIFHRILPHQNIQEKNK